MTLRFQIEHDWRGIGEPRRWAFLMVKVLALSMLLLADAAQAEQRQPSFQMDASAKRRLAANATSLKVGDSIHVVTNALGVPTYDQKLAGKENGRVIRRSLKYYALIWDRGLVNELHDELVSITLD